MRITDCTSLAWSLAISVCAAGTIVVGCTVFCQRGAAEGALAIGLPANVARQGVAFGWTVNYSNSEEARAKAMEYCTSFKQDEPSLAMCKVVEEFTDACIAIAMDQQRGTRGIGWAVRPTKRAAEEEAMAMCVASATPTREKDCVVVRSACDGKLW